MRSIISQLSIIDGGPHNLSAEIFRSGCLHRYQQEQSKGPQTMKAIEGVVTEKAQKFFDPGAGDELKAEAAEGKTGGGNGDKVFERKRPADTVQKNRHRQERTEEIYGDD